ncbi:MAG: serine/threonine-protein kinase RsbW [Acidobacteriota bacterium]|nr:serine/threonine-protein kinase RsbW [Acidobacteriota bacterium]
MSANKLEISEREVGEGIVMDLAGELTVGGTTDHLLDKVRARIESGCRLLVINMSQCRRVDSAGLGELVTCLVTATRHDAVFRLASVPQPIRGLMKMTNMHKAFEVFETEEEALK